MAIDKAIDSAKEAACRTAEANAIREKLGSSDPISYDFTGGQGFAAAIEQIPQGGSATEPYREETIGLDGYIVGAVLHGYTTIPGAAFAYQGSLESVTFADEVEAIDQSAFSGCTALELDELPSELRYIGPWAFYNCTSLSITEIPDLVVDIATEAFYGCTALEEITFLGTPYTLSNTAFSGCTNLTDIYVPWASGEVPGAPWGAENATVHYAGTPALTFVPILPDDTTAFPMYLKGYGKEVLNGGMTFNNRNENRLWTSTWGGHDYLSGLPDTTPIMSDLYPYGNKALATVDNKTFSVNRTSGTLNGNLILCDADVTENDTTANMSARWNAYLSAHPMTILLPMDNGSLRFAVKASDDTYGYYCPATEDYVVAYGMTGTVIERVEYVSFDGSQFANTGVNLLGSDTVEIDFVSNKSGINVFGSWHSNNVDVYTLYASTASSYVRYNSSLYRNTPIPLDTRLVFRMTPTGDYVGGTRYHTWDEGDFDTATPCLVGWLNGSGSPKLEGDVYEFTIEGKSNLIPVKVGSAYHLFDTKQWRFPTESGDFTGGSAVETPIDFPTAIYVPTASLLTMGGSPNPQPEPGEED